MLSHTIRDELSHMGFNNNYIDRAFKMFKKSYGEQYNINILTELIIRLQEKDKKKRHSAPYARLDLKHHFSPLQMQSANTHSHGSYNNILKLHKRQKPNINNMDILCNTPILPPPSNTKNVSQIDYHKKSKKRKQKKGMRRRRKSMRMRMHIPTISDDTNDVQTPPLPMYCSQKQINGRELKRMMTPSTGSSSADRCMRDRICSDDTLEQKRAALRVSLDEYSLSSPPTDNSDYAHGDMDDIMPDDMFQRESDKILMHNRQRYSLQDLRMNSNSKRMEKRKSDLIACYNTLSVPLFKELETTFSALKKIKDGVESKPKLRKVKSKKKEKVPVPVPVLNRRRQSEPTAKTVWNDVLIKRHEGMIDKIIGIKEYKLWDLNNERVALYRSKYNKVKYDRYVPALYDVLYPTILSSITLPPSLCSVDDKYRVNVVFDAATFRHDHDINRERAYCNCTYFEFSLNTRTIYVIDAMLDLIKNDVQSGIAWDTLYPTCFMLKIDGRDEYLKYNDNHKIMDLNYVRQCIRNDEMENVQFVLLYVCGLHDYNDDKYRTDLVSNYTNYDNYDSKYENMGFNVIFNALYDYDEKQENNENINAFDLCCEYVQDEVEWMETRTKHEGKAQEDGDDSMSYSSPNKDAILLSSFDSVIQLKICSVDNISLCPRYCANQHYFLLIRTELMFGTEVYEQCCFDVRIPCQLITDCIRIPYPQCSFSSDPSQLVYSMLPRECVWNITIYGVKKDEKRESELLMQHKKSEKKKIKNQPKLITRSTPSMINLDFNMKSSSNNERNPYDYDCMAISDDNRLISSAQRITASTVCNQAIVGSDLSESKYVPEAIAWCRIPLIDDKHCLNRGRHTMNVWSIPLQKHAKQKTDPYCIDRQIWKRFGATYPDTAKGKAKGKRVSITIEFVIDNDDDEHNEHNEHNEHIAMDDDCSSSITETFMRAPTTEVIALNHSFDIVAPIVNPRRIFSCESSAYQGKGKGKGKGRQLLSLVIENDDGNGSLSSRDKLLVSSHKSLLMRCGDTLCTYLSSVHWKDVFSRMECYSYLSKWTINNKNIDDVIALLKANFADNYVRLYAVSQLNKLDDFTLNKYLFQLIEALKVEIHHDSFLSRFLMYRALRNPYQIGHYLFWLIKAQLFVNAWYYERFALLIDEYLTHLPLSCRHNIFAQYELVNKLKIISSQIREKRKLSIHKRNKSLLNRETGKLLQKHLTALNASVFAQTHEGIQFPLNPCIKIKRIVVKKCCVVSNKKIVLRFITRHSSSCNTISVVFKYGEHIKYDVLTTNLLSIIDMLWLKNNIDLKIKRYGAIQMGSRSGFIQINNDTNHRNAKKTINVLFKNNVNCNEKKREFYARSLAGYCVATWILGIDVRKTNYKNILQITQNGELFYSNFAQLLFNNVNDNDPPFLFTNFMRIPIKDSNALYQQMEIWMFHAFCAIRQRYKLLQSILTLSAYSPLTQNTLNIAKYVKHQFKFKLRFDLNNYDNKIKRYIQDSLQYAMTHTTT